MAGSFESHPLPGDPTLAAWAAVLNEAGYWAYLFDASWRYAFVTDDLRLGSGDTGEVTNVPLGLHFFSAEGTRFRSTLGIGSPEMRRLRHPRLARFMLATTPGGGDALRRVIDPE